MAFVKPKYVTCAVCRCEERMGGEEGVGNRVEESLVGLCRLLGKITVNIRFMILIFILTDILQYWMIYDAGKVAC